MQYLHVIIYFCFALAVTAMLTNNGLKQIKLRLTEGKTKLNFRYLKERRIEQPLDQYDPHENRTFQMRYFENFEYWKPNGPVYVYIGGESEENGELIASHYGKRSLVVQLAEDTNGVMFATEHRYYGKSLPNITKDDKIKYYKYLSSKQALADIAMLIMKLKSDPKFASSPVVVVGGSYAGNLAAWMRLLYADVVDAAVAISAPVLAKKDFHEYLDTVRYTFGKYGTKNCLQNIEKAFKRIEDLLKSSAGIQTLKEELNICPKNDLTKLENQQCLFDKLYNRLKTTAQYMPHFIEYTCDSYEIAKNLTLDLDQFLNNDMLKDGFVKCDNVDDCWIVEGDDYMAWTYQYCTEFGYLQTTSSEKQPFVHWAPLEFTFKNCKGFVEGDIEKRIDEGVAKTNKMYGGLSPKVSKVVFPHGDMDPWHTLGVLQDLGPDAPAFMVNGTSHCDILIVNPEEPAIMKEKRKYVKELIKKWITNE